MRLGGRTIGEFAMYTAMPLLRARYPVLEGRLHAPVDTVYPIENIKEALTHADKGGRNGKILVSPNGAI